MTSNPDPCPECGGQLFVAIWALYAKQKKRDEDGNVVYDERILRDENGEVIVDSKGNPKTEKIPLYERDEHSEPDPHGEKGTDLRQDGVKCLNCGTKQFHRGVPARHEEQHGLPDNAVDNRPDEDKP